MSRPSYEKAKAVVAAAKSNPDKHGKLLETMNKTGKVNGVHKQLKVQRQAEDIAKEPPPLKRSSYPRTGSALPSRKGWPLSGRG